MFDLDGQCLRDMIPPDRRAGMDSLVESEGDGLLLPRFAPPPWEQFLPQAWGITDPDDLSWALRRLRPTPLGHFTTPVVRTNPAELGSVLFELFDTTLAASTRSGLPPVAVR